jgi:hypothetical protein
LQGFLNLLLTELVLVFSTITLSMYYRRQFTLMPSPNRLTFVGSL